MARRYHVPPGWPPLPTPDWLPPPGWEPNPTWPAPPPGWTFYRWVPGSVAVVVATLWVGFWLFLSSMAWFLVPSLVDMCPSAPCNNGYNTALPFMGVAQLSVLLLVLLCFLLRRPRAGLVLAVVGVPTVFISFAVVADAIIKAG
jgi:hypothetical protein